MLVVVVVVVEVVRGCTSGAMKIALVVMCSFACAVSLEGRCYHHSSNLRCQRQKHSKVELGVGSRQRIAVDIGSKLGVVVAVMAAAGKLCWAGVAEVPFHRCMRAD